MEMKDVRETARERMKGYCRVCPVCDGRACAGEVPGMGGLGTGTAFRANVTSLANVRFNMRLLHDAAEPETSVTILGRRLTMPVMAAPIGGVAFNMGGKVSEEDYIDAVVGGCHDEGILGCTGDGVPPFIHQAGFAAIRTAGGNGIPFIKPWEDAELFEKLENAKTAGATIVGMDVDAAGLITLKLMGRPVSPKPVGKLREIIARTGLQFIVKGILTPDEAELAAEAGASAIVVSNHGGRVLDHTPGIAEVLPAVSRAVKGRITVLADGGVRAGGDVLKLIALGADAVLIGRPFAIAAVGGLREGVVAYIRQIRSQLQAAMVLTGCRTIADADRRILFDA